MTKLIPILNGRCLVVELPEQDFIKAKIQTLVDLQTVWSGKLNFKSGDGWESISLPPGNWRIIGMLSEVREDDLDGIVESDTFMGGGVTIYKNYNQGGWLPSRVMSLDSAILAEGYYMDVNPYGETKPMAFEEDAVERQLWQSAQQKVLNKNRTIILERAK